MAVTDIVELAEAPEGGVTGVVPKPMLRPTGTPTPRRVTGEEKVPIELTVAVLAADLSAQH